MSVREVARLTTMDPWFLHQIREITLAQMAIAETTPKDIGAEQLRQLKRLGLSDERIATEWKLEGHAGIQQVRELRESKGIKPVFKLVDTCAAEFESMTPYLYSTYDEEDEAPPTDKPKIIILGSGPNRIGQGIEFDYCCCHAAFALKDDGYETIMVNCNPETVSTDYDTSDRLYFEPLVLEDVLAVYNHEAQSGAKIGMIVQFGGQTPLNLAQRLRAAGVPIIGTSPESIDLAEDANDSESSSTSWRFRSPPEAQPPVWKRHWLWVNASATRCWCGPAMSWAGAQWSSRMMPRPLPTTCARQWNIRRSGRCSWITFWRAPLKWTLMPSAIQRM